MSLFDDHNLAEIAHPDYPGERLVSARNPALAEERARTRQDLLAATEVELDKVVRSVEAGRLRAAGAIGVKAGKVIGKYKMAKHFELTIEDDVFSYALNQDSITEEANLDGIYIIRTSVDAATIDAAEVITNYKSLANVERDFRSIKAIDLDLRPIHHHTETRVKAHVFTCMLAAYLTWHLRKAWAPLTFTDEHRPEPEDPVVAAQRSTDAYKKASTRALPDGRPAHSFQPLLRHLATLTRNQMQITNADVPTFELLAEPTPDATGGF